MSLLNVLRGSQSLPLTKSSISITNEENDILKDDQVVTYYYYQNPSECTIEQVLILTLVQSESKTFKNFKLIDKPVGCADVAPNGRLPIWVNEANGFVLEPTSILSSHFAHVYGKYAMLIDEVSNYFQLNNKYNLVHCNIMSYFKKTSAPSLPVIPEGTEAASLPPALAYAIFHCSMFLLPLDDPLRMVIERNEEISSLYLQVLESK